MKGDDIIKGIDVSKHQGNIDWEKVKTDNIEFAIIRAGYGKLITQKDSKFDINYKGAKENGIKTGAYWFSYATNVEESKLEADIFMSIIKDYPMDLPVFYDYEYESVNYGTKMGITPTKDLATNMAEAFISELISNGYKAGLYSNPDFLKKWFDTGKFSKYPLWLAKWTGEAIENNPPAEYGDIICWQYSSKGSINGINGNVDLNYGYFKNTESSVIPVSAAPSEPAASVTASVLNVRSGPGTNYSIISKLYKGNLVEVLESYTNGWSKINIVGLIAYVNHSYLSIHKTTLLEFNSKQLIKVGSKVKVKSGSKTYNGKSLASFVYSTVYKVIQIDGDRVVIGLGKVVTAAVHIDNLILV